ncbi:MULTISPECIES: glutathione S-transferase family protein [Microbulbifer]|uniref:glutathione S-transferase family protein n=1 Tax=Microbulbifer TaxID=48073 RepID=UPI001E42A0D2|nr:MULTISPECIES: glutathione S-transferase family protein [Microbulbifer]UHQ56684.1 glutathione S-transferase family protein [Microbulbifer sp. YPW16]
MKLFITHASPYARATRIVVREQSLQSRVSEQVAHPFDNPPEFIASNPLGKVPCLLLDSGASIMDSQVICDYLDRGEGDGRLSLPSGEDWQLQTLHSVCQGLMDTLVLRRVEDARAQQGLRSDFWWDRYSHAAGRTLHWLEQRCDTLPGALSMTHISLGSALAYLDFRHPDISWRADFPRLARLSEQLEARPSFADTLLRD